MSAESFHFDSDFEFKAPVTLPGKTLEETLEIYFDQKCIIPKELRTIEDSVLISRYVKIVVDNVENDMGYDSFREMYYDFCIIDSDQFFQDSIYKSRHGMESYFEYQQIRDLNLSEHYLRLFGHAYDPYSWNKEDKNETSKMWVRIYHPSMYF